MRLEASWQARIEALLDDLPDNERATAAAELRDLITQHTPQGRAVAGPGGLAVGGDAHINAQSGSIAAGVINGGGSTGGPPVPDPTQG